MNIEDGSLIRSVDQPEVYLIVKGRARHLVDPETFESLGFNYFDVVELAADAAEKIPKGEPISIPEVSLTSRRSPSIYESPTLPDSKSAKRKNITVWAGFAIAISLAFVIAIGLPYLLVGGGGQSVEARFQSISAVRSSIVQLIGGLALVVGLYFTLQNVRLGRDIFSATLKQQASDRFFRAVEQLGDLERLEVRLAGIHILRRMAENSAEDRVVVTQIFCTLLRNHRASDEAKREARVEPAIAAMASVVSALSTTYPGTGLDLSNSDLAFLELPIVNLANATLGGASLEGAKIGQANLMYANLVGLNARGADLRRSNMVAALARNTNFEGADLSWSNLENAVFLSANMRGCSLVGCRLAGTVLIGADLRDSILRSTDLASADLSGAILDGAKIDQNTNLPAGFDPGVFHFESSV